MTALARIEAAGFTVTLKENGNLGVSPKDNLTNTQLTYLKAHKLEIIAELKAANDTDTYPRPIICHTPNGAPLQVTAKDAEHEAWLLKMNPTPPRAKPPEAKSGSVRIAEEALAMEALTQSGQVWCHQCRHHRPIKGRIQIIHCAVQNRRWLDDRPRNCGDFTAKT